MEASLVLLAAGGIPRRAERHENYAGLPGKTSHSTLIDMLIVEQEIEGTNVSAIDAVLAADKKRTSLKRRRIC